MHISRLNSLLKSSLRPQLFVEKLIRTRVLAPLCIFKIKTIKNRQGEWTVVKKRWGGKKQTWTGRQLNKQAQSKLVESTQQTYQQQAEAKIQSENASASIQRSLPVAKASLRKLSFRSQYKKKKTGCRTVTKSTCKPRTWQWQHRQLQPTLVEMWCFRGDGNRLKDWSNGQP